MHYIIICEHKKNSQEIRRSVHPAHVEYIHTLKTNGHVLTSGTAFADEETLTLDNAYTTITVAQFETIADANAWAAADPFATAQVYNHIHVYPYKELHDD